MGKFIKAAYPFLGAVLLFLFLQHNCAYDFYYKEQAHTFLFSMEYLEEVCSQPGGILEYIASFLIQFYVHPYVGAATLSIILLLLFPGLDRMCRKLSANFPLPFLVWLPCLFIVTLETDVNYYTEGTLAFLLCVGVMNLYLCIPFAWFRLLFMICVSPVFYYVAGPAVLMLVCWSALVETFSCSSIKYKSWIVVFWTLSFMLWWYCHGYSGEARTVFLPDAYYNIYMKPHNKIYYPWICLLSLGAIGGYVSSLNNGRKNKFIHRYLPILQVVGALWIGGYLFVLCHSPESYQLKRLEYYRCNHLWKAILKESLYCNRIPLHACYQNLALMQQGQFEAELFHRPQCGPLGLWMPWQGTPFQADLLSDIYMLQGNVAMAQKMAFTVMSSSRHALHPRMMLRLIETNLIYGNYKVAEKYIHLCEQTYAYAIPAANYRVYIKNPDTLEKSYLGELRRCLPKEDRRTIGVQTDLEQIIKANPQYRNAYLYAGYQFLLANDLKGFEVFLDKYHEMPGMIPLPIHFQEAAILLKGDNWRDYNVMEDVADKFETFKKLIRSNRPDDRRDISRQYKTTFWNYSFFKTNIQ